MAIKDRGMQKPKYLPRCPICNSKNTVGRVISAKKNKSGGFSACKAYFCSSCLTEFRDEDVQKRKKSSLAGTR